MGLALLRGGLAADAGQNSFRSEFQASEAAESRAFSKFRFFRNFEILKDKIMEIPPFAQAKKIFDAYKPFEIAKFEAVKKAAQSVLSHCEMTGEKFTENAVRLALPGQSSGTTRKYLPVALALLGVPPKDQQAETSPTDENLSVEIEVAIAKITEAVAALPLVIGGDRNKIIAAHSKILHSTVAENEIQLREQTELAKKAEANTVAMAAESEGKIDALEQLLVEKSAALNELMDRHNVAMREIEFGTIVVKNSEVRVSDLESQLADLKLHVIDAKRGAEKAAEVCAELSRAKDEQGYKHGEETEDMRRAFARDTDALRQAYDDKFEALLQTHNAEIFAIRAAHAREIADERDRNTRLEHAMLAALKPVETASAPASGEVAQ